MAKREVMKAAEFLIDHTFFLDGKPRSISAKQMKEKNIKINLPQSYWESFALKGIVKATDKQLEKIRAKINKKTAIKE
jgi:hypothetical protein